MLIWLVFLRVLEYYDGILFYLVFHGLKSLLTSQLGILILTSNRVGTFDEAFKSRIQLTLRYKNLEKDQRLQIWNNFMKRLDKMERSKHPESSSSVVRSGTNFGVDIQG